MGLEHPYVLIQSPKLNEQMDLDLESSYFSECTYCNQIGHRLVDATVLDLESLPTSSVE